MEHGEQPGSWAVGKERSLHGWNLHGNGGGLAFGTCLGFRQEDEEELPLQRGTVKTGQVPRAMWPELQYQKRLKSQTL